MIEVDVVMLAFTAKRPIFEMNCEAIESLRKSDPEIQFNVFLIESNVDFPNLGWKYDPEVMLIIPNEQFNFNRFNNIGRAQGNADWVLFCNNDVIFYPRFCSEMLKVNAHNPQIRCLCPVDPNSEFTPPGTFSEQAKYVIGHHVRKTFTGWCFLVQRSVFEEIGKFDERFDYYFADDDFTMQLRQHDILNAVVPKSRVKHLAHVTSKNTGLAISEKFKSDQEKFKMKWGNQRLIAWKNRVVEKILRPLGWKGLIKELYRHN